MSVFCYVGTLSTGGASTGTTTTLTDTGSTWTADEWIDETLRIDSGDQSGESRLITDNTTDTLTFSPALSAAASSGSGYRIARTVKAARGNASRQVAFVGDRHRSFDGTMRGFIRNRLDTWTVQTPPLGLADATTIEGTLTNSTQPQECGGEMFSSDSLVDCETDVIGSRWVEVSTGPREVLEVRFQESS